MSEKQNVFSAFGEYVRGVLDRNKNGRIDFKEILGLFPNSAIAIAALFVDLVVLIGEYRVFDFGMRVTNNDYFKAAGFVLASAVPFYLGQVFWLYPRANSLQKWIAAAMAIGGLVVSANLGFADLTLQYNLNETIRNVIYFSIACVGLSILYIVRDDGIRQWRMKVTTTAAAQLEKELQEVMRSTLTSLKETMAVQNEIVKEFGEDAVHAQLERMGKRPAFAQTAAQVQDRTPVQKPGNAPSVQFTWYDMPAFLKVLNLTEAQARAKWQGKSREEFAAEVAGKLDISGKNMRKLYYQLFPTAAGGK